MKREFLRGLGLEKETVDKIMAVNGADLEREKAKAAAAKAAAAKADLAEAQGKLAAAAEELERLKTSISVMAAMRQQLTDLQAKYDKDTGDLRTQLADRDYSAAVARAITGKGLKFSSKSAERAFTAALRERRLELKDGELTGLEDFIQAQKEADPEAFAPEKDCRGRVILGGAPGRLHNTCGRSQRAPRTERMNRQCLSLSRRQRRPARAANRPLIRSGAVLRCRTG